MTLWRSSLLALAASAALIGGPGLAAADGPPAAGRIADGPGIPLTWTGLYAGAHIGGIDDAFGDEALVGGVQIGRTWQMGKMVYGLEADISFTDAEGIDVLGTVRGRIGYLLHPSIMAYGTAGLGIIEFADEGTETDFVYGLGVEGILTQRTTVRVEYLGFTDTEVDVIRAGINFKF